MSDIGTFQNLFTLGILYFIIFSDIIQFKEQKWLRKL